MVARNVEVARDRLELLVQAMRSGILRKLPGQGCTAATHVEVGGMLRKAKVPGSRKTVPYFVPTLHQEPSHLVAIGGGRKSPVLVRKINTIANRRTRSET